MENHPTTFPEAATKQRAQLLDFSVKKAQNLQLNDNYQTKTDRSLEAVYNLTHLTKQ